VFIAKSVPSEASLACLPHLIQESVAGAVPVGSTHGCTRLASKILERVALVPSSLSLATIVS
jgi:hypothetical protein